MQISVREITRDVIGNVLEEIRIRFRSTVGVVEKLGVVPGQRAQSRLGIFWAQEKWLARNV